MLVRLVGWLAGVLGCSRRSHQTRMIDLARSNRPRLLPLAALPPLRPGRSIDATPGHALLGPCVCGRRGGRLIDVCVIQLTSVLCLCICGGSDRGRHQRKAIRTVHAATDAPSSFIPASYRFIHRYQTGTNGWNDVPSSCCFFFRLARASFPPRPPHPSQTCDATQSDF